MASVCVSWQEKWNCFTSFPNFSFQNERRLQVTAICGNQQNSSSKNCHNHLLIIKMMLFGCIIAWRHHCVRDRHWAHNLWPSLCAAFLNPNVPNAGQKASERGFSSLIESLGTQNSRVVDDNGHHRPSGQQRRLQMPEGAATIVLNH